MGAGRVEDVLKNAFWQQKRA